MFARYYYTLRHLKFIQIVGRLWQRFYRPSPDLKSAPKLRGPRRGWIKASWRSPAMLGPQEFLFLNDKKTLCLPSDWNENSLGKLWLYNLHYFDDLNASGAHARVEWHKSLIGQWVQENPPGSGNGWEPYPSSLRIVNWIKWSLSDNVLEINALDSLAVQARYLRKRLEYHLLGNHLFENAKALVFVGVFFSGEEACEWLTIGRKIIDRQLDEQILSDGGHFELSPMYHALVLEGILDLINLFQVYELSVPVGWLEVIPKMFSWLETMCHPDGDFSFFNDTALAGAPDRAHLIKYAKQLGVNIHSVSSGTKILKDSGYARLAYGNSVVIADIANVGPDYLPGHAHADSLSFELSVKNQRVLVNTGTSVYGRGADRQYQRGTSAHNTVKVDGINSSDVWAGFRVGRRAKTQLEEFSACLFPSLQAIHDGYFFLDGKIKHRRLWETGENMLEVTDVLDGHGVHLFEVFFHLHPRFELKQINSCCFLAEQSRGDIKLEIYVDAGLEWSTQYGAWHRGFGFSEENMCLKGEGNNQFPVRFSTQFNWTV